MFPMGTAAPCAHRLPSERWNNKSPEPVGLTVLPQWAVRIRERAMTDPRVAERARAAGAHEAAQTVKGFCEALPAPERAEEFGAFFDRFADAKVVLLGEATHGTSEFYRARAAITRRLIERHGFTIVAVEADWPDAARIDAYVRHHAPRGRGGSVQPLPDLDVAKRRGARLRGLDAGPQRGAAARAAGRVPRP